MYFHKALKEFTQGYWFTTGMYFRIIYFYSTVVFFYGFKKNIKNIMGKYYDLCNSICFVSILYLPLLFVAPIFLDRLFYFFSILHVVFWTFFILQIKGKFNTAIILSTILIKFFLIILIWFYFSDNIQYFIKYENLIFNFFLNHA